MNDLDRFVENLEQNRIVPSNNDHPEGSEQTSTHSAGVDDQGPEDGDDDSPAVQGGSGAPGGGKQNRFRPNKDWWDKVFVYLNNNTGLVGKPTALFNDLRHKQVVTFPDGYTAREFSQKFARMRDDVLIPAVKRFHEAKAAKETWTDGSDAWEIALREANLLDAWKRRFKDPKVAFFVGCHCWKYTLHRDLQRESKTKNEAMMLEADSYLDEGRIGGTTGRVSRAARREFHEALDEMGHRQKHAKLSSRRALAEFEDEQERRRREIVDGRKAERVRLETLRKNKAEPRDNDGEGMLRRRMGDNDNDSISSNSEQISDDDVLVSEFDDDDDNNENEKAIENLRNRKKANKDLKRSRPSSSFKSIARSSITTTSSSKATSVKEFIRGSANATPLTDVDRRLFNIERRLEQKLEQTLDCKLDAIKDDMDRKFDAIKDDMDIKLGAVVDEIKAIFRGRTFQ